MLNAGKINNNGIEVQLGLVPVKTAKFSWDVDLNYARNNSEVKVLDYDGQIQNYTIGSSGGVEVLASVGQAWKV